MREKSLVCSLAILAVLRAQEAPTIRVNTHLVQINVIVRDKNGPVSNLTKSDFVLTEKGKPRNISVFSVDSNRGDPAKQAALPPNTFSNRPHRDGATPASVTIILLDGLNTLTGGASDAYEPASAYAEEQALANAKQHLVKFVAQMDPKDRVAVYSLRRSLTVLSDFTNDRVQLQTILKNYQATSLTSRETVEPLETFTPVPGGFNGNVDQDRHNLAAIANRKRTETTMAALLSIAAHVADIPGRKNLVWLTSNLPFSGTGIARALSRANLAVYPVDARGLLARATGFSNADEMASIVFSKTGGVGSQGSRPAGISTMEDLADGTGGRAFVNTNDLAGAIGKAVEDAEVTYTLGFYPEAESLDGKFHELKVHLKRAGAEVRYPRGYFALKDAPASGSERQSGFQRAMWSPLESSSIHAMVRVDRSDQPKPNMLRIAGAIDLADLQLSHEHDSWNGALEVIIAQQDATGKVLDQTRDHYDLQLTDQLYETYLKPGIQFAKDVERKDGLATIRILFSSKGNAQVGSLIIPAGEIR